MVNTLQTTCYTAPFAVLLPTALDSNTPPLYVLSDGSVTLSGVPVSTTTGTETLTNKTLVNPIYTQTVRTSAQTDNATTTLANVAGLSVAVTAAGVYAFKAHLATTCNVAGGTKAAMGGTSTWTSINTTTYTYTATAVAVNTGTTATAGTSIAGATAQNIATIIEGTVVINAAGTLTVMFAQNASNGAASSVLVNSYLDVRRIA